jgi:hypothetical protein
MQIHGVGMMEDLFVETFKPGGHSTVTSWKLSGSYGTNHGMTGLCFHLVL